MKRSTLRFILLAQFVVLVSVLGFAHFALAADGGGGCTGKLVKDTAGNVQNINCINGLPCWGTGTCSKITTGPPAPGGGIGFPKTIFCACVLPNTPVNAVPECLKAMILAADGTKTENAACESQSPCPNKPQCKTVVEPTTLPDGTPNGTNTYCDCP